MSSSRSNFHHFGTSSPALAFDATRTAPSGASRKTRSPKRGSAEPRRAVRRLLLRSLYRLYKIWLHRQVCIQPAPRHVGIILDGNRRYARRHGVSDPQKSMPLARGNSTICSNGAASCEFQRLPCGRSQPIISAGDQQPRCPASLPQLRPSLQRLSRSLDSSAAGSRKGCWSTRNAAESTVAVIRAAEEATASYKMV